MKEKKGLKLPNESARVTDKEAEKFDGGGVKEFIKENFTPDPNAPAWIKILVPTLSAAIIATGIALAATGNMGSLGGDPRDLIENPENSIEPVSETVI